MEKALRTYLAARRQTRMIEILEERAYSQFRRDLAKRELKEQDELVVLRARFAEDSPVAWDFRIGDAPGPGEERA